MIGVTCSFKLLRKDKGTERAKAIEEGGGFVRTKEAQILNQGLGLLGFRA